LAATLKNLVLDFRTWLHDGHECSTEQADVKRRIAIYSKAMTACFDPKPTKEGESQIGTGHFFRLNLRQDHFDYLDLSRPGDGKKHRCLKIRMKFSSCRGQGEGTRLADRSDFCWSDKVISVRE